MGRYEKRRRMKDDTVGRSGRCTALPLAAAC
jgi:hypothetical protein